MLPLPRRSTLRKALCAIALAGAALVAGPACSGGSARSTALSVFASTGYTNTKIADCVMYRESRYQPNVTGYNRNGTYDSGLFQINSIHATAFTQVTGQSWSRRYDPYWNARYAKHLVETAGWAPWGGGC